MPNVEDIDRDGFGTGVRPQSIRRRCGLLETGVVRVTAWAHRQPRAPCVIGDQLQRGTRTFALSSAGPHHRSPGEVAHVAAPTGGAGAAGSRAGAAGGRRPGPAADGAGHGADAAVAADAPAAGAAAPSWARPARPDSRRADSRDPDEAPGRGHQRVRHAARREAGRGPPEDRGHRRSDDRRTRWRRSAPRPGPRPIASPTSPGRSSCWPSPATRASRWCCSARPRSPSSTPCMQGNWCRRAGTRGNR